MFTPHHVGIVVSDIEAAMKGYIENLGYRFFQFEVNEGNASLSESSATFSLRFGMGQLGLSFVELIQPISGTTLYSKHLDENGPGLHHLGYSALDLGAARKQFTSSGYNCLQTGKSTGLSSSVTTRPRTLPASSSRCNFLVTSRRSCFNPPNLTRNRAVKLPKCLCFKGPPLPPLPQLYPVAMA